jgi:crotonobetainyl-CoA:carnitine CoA-transferase CaiB-like acyl-CoA transferase
VKLSALPYAGLKVLDLSRVLAGPYAAQILGDLGADVIKVEPPGAGDETRTWGPPYWNDLSAYYLTANRNKKIIRANFKSEKDLRVVQDLAQDADVVIENFKTGSLAKFDLDAPSLLKLNPKLVYCSITGFGQTGPRAHEPGYDVLIQAMSGFMSITGESTQGPMKAGVAIADLCTALYSVIAIQAALKERETSHQGQHIDMSLFDVQTSLLANVGMNFLVSKQVPESYGNEHPSIVPYGAYPTQDQPLMICVGNDHQFQSLCLALDVDWNNDERFSSNPQRVLHRSALKNILIHKLQQKPRSYWLQAFEGKGFPFGPVNSLAQMAQDPQTKSRELLIEGDNKRPPFLRSPLRFSRNKMEKYELPKEVNQASWEQ